MGVVWPQANRHQIKSTRLKYNNPNHLNVKSKWLVYVVNCCKSLSKTCGRCGKLFKSGLDAEVNQCVCVCVCVTVCISLDYC